MKKLKTVLVLIMLSMLFCVGCGKKDGDASDDIQQGHTVDDGHDHSEHDGHDH